MAVVYLSPIGNSVIPFLNANGAPNANGFLSTFLAGTSTPSATYTTSAGTVQNAVSIPLGPDGRVPNEVWLVTAIAYKFVLLDSLGVLVPGCTYDNITGQNDPASFGAGVMASLTVSGATSLNTLVASGSLVWGTGIATKGLIVLRKTADESVTSSVVLQNDDHLTFPIAANEEWLVELTAFLGTSLTTTGYKAAFTVPAGATMRAWGFSLLTSASVTDVSSSTTSSGTPFIGVTPALGNNGALKLFLWVLNGATPGNVTFQWAQATSVGTALTIFKGSYMTANRVT